MGPEALCHAVPHRIAFSGDGWMFELKHDGFRALARSGARVQLLSRWGRSMVDASGNCRGAR
jgi:ATP-dependent DNA ligase